MKRICCDLLQCLFAYVIAVVISEMIYYAEYRKAIKKLGKRKAHLGRFVEETRASAAVQEVVVLFYVTV